MQNVEMAIVVSGRVNVVLVLRKTAVALILVV